MIKELAGAERVFEVMDEAPEKDEGQVVLVGVTKQADGRIDVNPDGSHPTH